MAIPLSDQLQQAVEQHPGEPIRVIDTRTRAEYVLIRAETYERLARLAGPDPEAAYPLVDETFREGWSGPAMAEYDRYEAHKNP